MVAGVGRFGPYIRYDGMFVSIPKDMAPETISLDEAVKLVADKREKEAQKLIKEFAELPGIQVLNGRFGPYIAFKPDGAKKTVNYKIPKGTEASSLTAADVKEIMEKQDAAPKKPARRAAKAKK